MNAIAFVVLTSLAAAPALQQDRSRVRELLRQAEEDNQAGKPAEANKKLAEAWAITADIYWEQGNPTSADQAWQTARRFGWTGPSPLQKSRPPVVPTYPPPPSQSLPPPAPRRNGFQDDATPRFEQTRRYSERKRIAGMEDQWETTALSPYAGPRNNAWHALFNTPPLEEAATLPFDVHQVSFTVDIASAEFSATSGGGPTNWDTGLLSEHIEYNYGLTDSFQVGARLSLGELGESGDPITVFDGGVQIVPTGDRSFGVESLVGRAKWAVQSDFLDFGALGELKIPLAGDEDFLSAKTIDAGFSGLVTKRFGIFALHLNAGMVLPFGDIDHFDPDPDADPYVHGGAALAVRVHDWVSLFAQAEFNGSAFGDVAVLDEPVTAVHFGGRYRATGTVYFALALGFGLSEESGDTFLSSGLDVLF